MIPQPSHSRPAAAPVAAFGILLALSAGPSAAQAENFTRGHDLYTLQCQSCHEDLMHERNRKLKNLAQLRKRIEDWAAHTGNTWTREDIDDVLYYLNKSFYRFDQ